MLMFRFWITYNKLLCTDHPQPSAASAHVCVCYEASDDRTRTTLDGCMYILRSISFGVFVLDRHFLRRHCVLHRGSFCSACTGPVGTLSLRSGACPALVGGLVPGQSRPTLALFHGKAFCRTKAINIVENSFKRRGTAAAVPVT